MSRYQNDVHLTEEFLGVSLPAFFGVDNCTDLDGAFEDYMGNVQTIANPNDKHYESRFTWQYVNEIAEEMANCSPRQTEKRQMSAIAAGGITLGVGCNLEDNRVAQGSYSPTDRVVNSTNRGTLVTVNEAGRVQFGTHTDNPETDGDDRNPTYSVFEKLGWAKIAELLTRQGADWGDGYTALSNYLHTIGRLGRAALPHVGMATAHRFPFSEETRGQDRQASAFAAAADYTLTPSSIGDLLKDRRFFELYRRDLVLGRFTNISDWLSGRLNSLVARRACEIHTRGTEGPFSTDFPYMDNPDYFHVDNN